MAIAQGTSANVWFEPPPTVGGGTNTPIAAWLSDNGHGGYKISTTAALAARMLDNAHGGFTDHAGTTNPTALAELTFVDTGSKIKTVQ